MVLHVLEQQAREFLCAVVTGEVVAVKEVGVGETSVSKVVQEDDVGIVCGNGGKRVTHFLLERGVTGSVIAGSDGRHDEEKLHVVFVAVGCHFSDSLFILLKDARVGEHEFLVVGSLLFAFLNPGGFHLFLWQSGVEPPGVTVFGVHSGEIVLTEFAEGERFQHEHFKMVREVVGLVNVHVDAVAVLVRVVVGESVVHPERLESDAPDEISQFAEVRRIFLKDHVVVGHKFSGDGKVEGFLRFWEDGSIDAGVCDRAADDEGAELRSSCRHDAVFEGIEIRNAAYAPLKRPSGEKDDEREKTDRGDESFHVLGRDETH